jgi:hypothetical protein
MNKVIKEKLKTWINKQSHEQLQKIALDAIERLIETEDVHFRVREHWMEEDTQEEPYWDSCGDTLGKNQ